MSSLHNIFGPIQIMLDDGFINKKITFIGVILGEGCCKTSQNSNLDDLACEN